MYLSHWGLTNSPFSKDRDVGSFFNAPAHDEALARLQFLVNHQRRLGLLCGPRGSGKSLLLDVFAAQLRKSGRQVAQASLLGRSPREFLWEIANEFGATPGREEETSSLWRTITDRVVQNRWQHIETVLLLDDVDEAGPDFMALFSRLVEIDTSPEARWTIVLTTGEDNYRRLGERLLDRVALRIDLARWQPQDTINYVRKTIESAGGDASILDEDALQKLHDLADGVPRRINQLADLALVAGAGQQLSQLDSQTVESAAELAVV